ncbi:MAG: thioredoxin family protein, partial [Hyphomonadaceae bacterium]|nr:thioredoxin family protein [Hyphomonadaceae bacterium]
LAGLVFAFGAWAVRWARAGALLAGAAGAALLLFFGLAGQGGVAARPDEAAVSGSWRAWSASAVATEQAAGRPVFVDFTAAWCVTCQVNKALVLSKADVAAAFVATDTALFEADWTTRSPQIAAELARHGRVGVPLYLLYTPGRAAPEILPQQLDGERLKAKLAAAAAAAAAAEPAD